MRHDTSTHIKKCALSCMLSDAALPYKRSYIYVLHRSPRLMTAPHPNKTNTTYKMKGRKRERKTETALCTHYAWCVTPALIMPTLITLTNFNTDFV